MEHGRVITVCVGTARDEEWAGRMKRTAIDKRPVTGRVKVGELGLVGDEQADLKNHGGVEQAVYVYAREDLDLWAAALGRELRDGAFGENQLTSVSIPAGVVEVGQAAFAVNELTALSISATVTTIGPAAFADNLLTEVELPPSVTDIPLWRSRTTA